MKKKKAIVLAEKISLMNDIKSVYMKHKEEYDYEIVFYGAFIGHVYKFATFSEYIDYKDDVWKIDKLPIIPNELLVIPIENKIKIIEQLKNAITKYNPDIIINACDAEREGEHIFRLFIDNAIPDKSKYEFKRFWNNSLAENDIHKSLKNLLNDSEKANLRESAYLRGMSDLLCGLNFTEGCTSQFLRGKGILNAGRVKSTLLNICYQKEQQIIEFENSEHKSNYIIKSIYDNELKGILIDENKNKKIFETLEDVTNYINNDIASGNHKIINIEKNNAKTNPPMLHKMATLQSEANNFYGYSPKKTLEIAQTLYENKLISYPRTDLEFLSTELCKNMTSYLHTILSYSSKYNIINDIFKSNELKNILNNKRICNDNEVLTSESGHTALIVTENIPNNLTEEQQNIYELIANRMVAILLPPLLEECVTVYAIDDKKNNFKITYKNLIEKGYTNFLENTTNYFNNDLKSPLSVESIEPHEIKPTKPKRFTEGTLIELMSNPYKYLIDNNNENRQILKNTKGIGQSSTRATHINSLFQDKYCELKNGYIYVTDFGMNFMDIIHEFEFSQVDLTCNMELKLSNVATGKLSPEEYKKFLYQYVKDTINDIKKCDKKIFLNSTGQNNINFVKDAKCPICGNNIVEAEKFYICEKYKYDKNAKQSIGCPFYIFKETNNKIKYKINKTNFLKLIKNKSVTVTVEKENKKWEQEMKLDENYKLTFVKKTYNNETQYKCPKCKKENLIENDYLLSCKCGFKLWKKVYNQIKLDKKSIEELLIKQHTSKSFHYVTQKGYEMDVKLKMENFEVQFDLPQKK